MGKVGLHTDGQLISLAAVALEAWYRSRRSGPPPQRGILKPYLNIGPIRAGPACAAFSMRLADRSLHIKGHRDTVRDLQP